LVADKDDKAPRKPPIGVRAIPTTHKSVDNREGAKTRQLTCLNKNYIIASVREGIISLMCTCHEA